MKFTGLLLGLGSIVVSTTAFAQPVSWTWNGQPPPGGTQTQLDATSATGVRCSFDNNRPSGRSGVTCREPNGSVRWQHDYQDREWNRATFVIHNNTLFVVRFHDISSGASATAFDLTTGQQRWQTALQALGPVSHSQYFASVQTVVRSGRLIVFGWEAGGRYIEQLDANTGLLISNQRP